MAAGVDSSMILLHRPSSLLIVLYLLQIWLKLLAESYQSLLITTSSRASFKCGNMWGQTRRHVLMCKDSLAPVMRTAAPGNGGTDGDGPAIRHGLVGHKSTDTYRRRRGGHRHLDDETAFKTLDSNLPQLCFEYCRRLQLRLQSNGATTQGSLLRTGLHVQHTIHSTNILQPIFDAITHADRQ